MYRAALPMSADSRVQSGGGPFFGFPAGKPLERRYVLGEFIGSGYEGEVYHLTEASTGIERVVKFFRPDRFRDPKRAIRVARKFHLLRRSSVVLQYHHYGELVWRRQKIGYMVSELATGRVLADLIRERPRRRLPAFEALHLIHAVARGVAEIHALRTYHGDIHEHNILVERHGLGFRIKLIDLYLHPRDTTDQRRLDVVDIAYLLYRLVGGPQGYPGSPELVKQIVCGRRRRTIFRRFPTAGALVQFMEGYTWT